MDLMPMVLIMGKDLCVNRAGEIEREADRGNVFVECHDALMMYLMVPEVVPAPKLLTQGDRNG